ncbi:MAG: hypothetical protein U0441_38635, partial [Polyangiaceae bacterium]
MHPIRPIPGAARKAYSSSPGLALLLLAVLFRTTACVPRYRRCPEPETAHEVPREKQALSTTGLYRDIRTGQLADGVTAYEPAYELWSDGAAKKRWIWLPPGATIDAADMDAWQFPAGTKIWKEFVRDGVRAETRLLEKTGPGPEDWFAMAYLWSADGADAVAAPQGAMDVLGTTHDVPPARDCAGCHRGTPGGVLGFGAIQLNHKAAEGEWSLDRLVQEGRLHGGTATVRPVPGDERTQKVLGYLHANCAHCHNEHRPPELPGGRCYNPRSHLDLSLRVADLG